MPKFRLIISLLICCILSFIVLDQTYAQERKYSYMISGMGSFLWSSEKDDPLYGDINTYRYSTSICFTLIENRKEKGELLSTSSFGIMFLQKNADDFTDSLIWLKREYFIFPYLRYNLPYGFFIDTGLSLNLFQNKYKDNLSNRNLVTGREWARKNLYWQIVAGYHYKINARAYLTPIIYIPLIRTDLDQVKKDSRMFINLNLSIILRR